MIFGFRNPTTTHPFRSLAWGNVLACVLTIGLITRVFFNVDLSDEAYYAIFIHDWIISGVKNSTLSTIHQSAALICYPFIIIYSKFAGEMNGLILALRFFYLLGTFASATTMQIFVRQIRGRNCGWLSASAIIAFVPFGLPAPSYNTLGLQGLTTALAAFGCAAVSEQGGRRSLTWRIISAIAWAVAIVAYPTLGLPCSLFCMLIIIEGRAEFHWGRSYALTIALVVSAALAVVICTLTPEKISNSITYLNDVNGVSSLQEKIAKSLIIMQGSSYFSASLLFVLIIGLFRKKLSIRLICTLSTLSLLALEIEPQTLFLRSHDAIVLAAVSGFGLLTGLRPGTSNEDRTIALIVITSLFAGITTAATAFNGVFNLCIGCAPAAVITMAAPRSVLPIDCLLRAISQFCLVLVLADASASHLYGDDPSDYRSRVRIEQGPFAGLLIQQDQARLIEYVASLKDLGPTPASVAEFGRLPGLILAMNRQALQLMTLPPPTLGAQALATTQAFYGRSENRPSLVLIASDQYETAFNPMGNSFLNWYYICSHLSQKLTTIDVYCRK